MKNITSDMVDAALQAHYRNSGTPASTAGMRAALHTVKMPQLTEARRCCLGVAIKCIEAAYDKQVSGDITFELKQLLAELEAAQ